MKTKPMKEDEINKIGTDLIEAGLNDITDRIWECYGQVNKEDGENLIKYVEGQFLIIGIRGLR